MESTELVQQLLVGSERTNKMRKEIDDFIGMILGFLNKNDLSRFKHQEVICRFESIGFCWIIEMAKSFLWVKVTKSLSSDLAYDSLYLYTYGAGYQIPLKYVQPIRQGLPDFLTNMRKIFPQLEERFAPLLEAAETQKVL